MNRIFKSALLPSLVATSLVGVNLVSMKPVAAGDHQIRDIGIGAGASTVTGEITGHHHAAKNAINGAAAGAAVHALDHGNCHRRGGHLVRDVGVGAGASTVAGLITNRHHTLSNAVNGAVAGGAVNLAGC